MDLDAARRMGEEVLASLGLAARGWRFGFDTARRRFGVCRYDRRRITLSAPLVRVNDEAEVRDTLLHEAAHALAGPEAGHGPAWQQICRRIGARPERCYTAEAVAPAPPPYWAECPACGRRTPLYRRPRVARACGRCCRAHAQGQFDARFRLEVVDARTGAPVPAAPGVEGVCPACGARYPFARRPRVARACGRCCRTHTGGRFDPRFRLRIENARDPS